MYFTTIPQKNHPVLRAVAALRAVFASCLFLLAYLHSPQALAEDRGPFGIDYKWEKDESGIFQRPTQLNVMYAMMATSLGGAFWNGSETRLGRTFWQSSDALATSAITGQVFKQVFTRKRPRENEGPNKFFSGGQHESFVSGEVIVVTAMVVPWILEYQEDQPAVYALALLPIYDGIARMKSEAHWQSDVLASAILGTAWGVWAHNRQTPWLLGATADGISIGWRKKF